MLTLRLWPRSFLFFALALLVVLLQVIPYTGIFLMLVAGPFWSVILINAGMLALLVEATIGRVSRLWLLVPLLWFAGYAGLHMLSQRQFANLQTTLSTHNARQSLAFNEKSDVLVLSNAGQSVGASGLVQGYDIPVAYQASREGTERATRLARDEDCRRLGADPAARGAGIYPHWFHEESGSTRRLVPGLCILTGPEAAKEPRVVVTARHERFKGFLLPHEKVTLTVRHADGREIILLYATAHPLHVIPGPIIGCALNSGAPSWNCFAQFMREGYRGVGATDGGGATSILAKALGLRASPASERRDQVSPQDIQTNAADIIARQAAEDLEKVVDSFTNPGRRLTIHDVSTLRNRPALYQGHVPVILETIRRSLQKPEPTPRGGPRSPPGVNRYQPETARSLQLLIGGLPAESAEAPLRQIMTMLADNPALEPAMVAPEVVLRFSNFGADAVYLLERLAFHGGRPNMLSAIQGLCRIGAPAAHLADMLARELDRKRNDTWSERRIAAYIAILRFGRQDIADRDADQDSYYKQPSYRRWRETVGPKSDPAVCLEMK